MLRTSSHEINQLLRNIEDLGGRYRQTKSNHVRVFDRQGRLVTTMPNSPGSRGSVKACMAQLRKAGLLQDTRRKGSVPHPMPSTFKVDKFLAALFREIKERGWTKAELARQTGISGPAVVQFMGGVQRPSRESVEKIKKVLDWSDEYGTKVATNGKPTLTPAEVAKRLRKPAEAIAVEAPPAPEPEPEPPLSPYQELDLAHAKLEREYKLLDNERVDLELAAKRLYDQNVKLCEVMVGVMEVVADPDGPIPLRVQKILADHPDPRLTRAWKVIDAFTAGESQ